MQGFTLRNNIVFQVSLATLACQCFVDFVTSSPLAINPRMVNYPWLDHCDAGNKPLPQQQLDILTQENPIHISQIKNKKSIKIKKRSR